MNQISTGQEIIANGEVVNRLTEEFTEHILTRLIEEKVTFPDAFMVMHNVHKRGVMSVGYEWEKAGIPREKTFRMADKTFRKAMQSLWRTLPTV